MIKKYEKFVVHQDVLLCQDSRMPGSFTIPVKQPTADTTQAKKGCSFICAEINICILYWYSLNC